jgi:hypothetical protein
MIPLVATTCTLSIHIWLGLTAVSGVLRLFVLLGPVEGIARSHVRSCEKWIEGDRWQDRQLEGL